VAAIFPPQDKGGVAPGPNVVNGFTPSHSVIGDGPLYISPNCTTILTDAQLNAITSELLAAVDDLDFAFNTTRIDNLGQALRAHFEHVNLDIAAKVAKAGDTMSGPLVLPGPPANDNEATTKGYVDAQDAALNTDLRNYIDSETASIMQAAQNLVAALDAAKVNRAGDQMTGSLLLVGNPTEPTEAVSKAYVDNIFLSEGHFVDAPTDGQLYGRQSAAWQPAVGVNGPLNLNTTQQTQWRQSISAAPLDALAYNGMQINGGMDISQERGGNPITNPNQYAYYVIDNWEFGASTACSASQVADAPPGYVYSLKVQVVTPQPTLAALDITGIFTLIEGFRIRRLSLGSSIAKPFSIAFWVKVHRPGTYSGCVRNQPNPDWMYAFPFTVNAADTWEYKTVTIAPPLTGTFDSGNMPGLQVQFNMSAGADRMTIPGQWITGTNAVAALGTINGIAAATDYMAISGFLLLPGIELPTAEQSPLLQKPFEHEQLFCRRYYYSLLPSAAGVVGPSGTYLERMSIQHPVHMRSNAPTVTIIPPVSAFDGAMTAQLTSIAINYSTSEVMEFDANVNATLVAYRPAKIFQTDGGVVGKIAVNARM